MISPVDLTARQEPVFFMLTARLCKI